jgi:hypothetical protein
MVDFVVPAAGSISMVHDHNIPERCFRDDWSSAFSDKKVLTTRSTDWLATNRIREGIQSAHLISVTPEIVLCSDVLVRVFGSLLQRLHVRPVSPMLVPQIISVDTGNDQARNRNTVEVSLIPLVPLP